MDKIKTWEERLPLCPSQQEMIGVMELEIADLRATLAARASQPVGDLQAAILALPLPEPSLGREYLDFGRVEIADGDGYTASQMRDLLAAAASLAASAQAPVVLAPEGWKLVPETSTYDMDCAGERAYEQNGYCDCGNANGCGMGAVFAAMLEHTPTPPVIAHSADKESV